MPSPAAGSLFCLLVVISLSSTCAQSEVDFSALRLPSDALPDDVCPISHPASCPVTCFRPDPVCGVDGITYWCGCDDAACSGARVAKLGFCEVGDGGDGLVSGQALLLVHMVWLIVLGFSVLFGFF